MKTLHLLDSLNRGGIEILALDLFKNSGKNGLDITFVATGNGELEEEFKDSGVDFIKLKRKFAVDPFIVLKLRSIIKKKKIDIVHSNRAVEGIHAYLATRGTEVKIVQSYHGYVPEDKKDNLILKFLAHKMDANIIVSKGFGERLKVQSKIKDYNNFHVIYNGIDQNKLIVKQSFCLGKELRIKESSFIAGMVGNFQSGKDQLTICKALSLIIKKFPEFHLVFIGGLIKSTPQYYNQCIDFCENNNLMNYVSFLGRRQDIPSLLKSLDLFVFSSIEDTFGIAVVEAMLMGVPVIVSNIPPLLEITDNGRKGFIFETGNSEDLASKIISLIEDREKLNSLKLAAKKWAQDNYSIEKYIENLKKLYMSLL